MGKVRESSLCERVWTAGAPTVKLGCSCSERVFAMQWFQTSEMTPALDVAALADIVARLASRFTRDASVARRDLSTVSTGCRKPARNSRRKRRRRSRAASAVFGRVAAASGMPSRSSAVASAPLPSAAAAAASPSAYYYYYYHPLGLRPPVFGLLRPSASFGDTTLTTYVLLRIVLLHLLVYITAAVCSRRLRRLRLSCASDI
jgi:hypothetical protein